MIFSVSKSRSFASFGFLVVVLAGCFAHAEEWPVNRAGLLLSFDTLQGDLDARNVAGDRLYGVTFEPRGKARADHDGRLLVQEGSYELSDGTAYVMSRIRETRAFTLEVVLTPELGNLEEPATALTLASKPNGPIVRLNQERDHLVLSLNASGGNDIMSVPLCAVEAGKAIQVTIAFSEDGLHTYRNGDSAAEQKKSTIDFATWPDDARLVLGAALDGSADWRGRIEGVAFFAAALTPDQVTQDYEVYREKLATRVPVPVLRVRAKLIGKSPVPSTEELAPYTRSLSVYAYSVVETLEGEYNDDTLYVAHWCVLDAKQLAFKDAGLGKVYELTLEPFEENPQLESENLSDSIVEDFALPLYYDAGGLSLGLRPAEP
jgi:hypothetical protein